MYAGSEEDKLKKVCYESSCRALVEIIK